MYWTKVQYTASSVFARKDLGPIGDEVKIAPPGMILPGRMRLLNSAEVGGFMDR